MTFNDVLGRFLTFNWQFLTFLWDLASFYDVGDVIRHLVTFLDFLWRLGDIRGAYELKTYFAYRWRHGCWSVPLSEPGRYGDSDFSGAAELQLVGGEDHASSGSRVITVNFYLYIRNCAKCWKSVQMCWYFAQPAPNRVCKNVLCKCAKC